MTIKVGINGFGRIGRQVYKAIYENYKGVLDVEAINDLMPVETNAHMLKYDSTYGRFPGKVEVKDGDLYIDDEKLKSYAERNPADLPWGELGVDIVLECTGRFRDGESAAKHIQAGAKKVLISAPGKDIDATFVLGVNQDTYDPDNHHIISNASCTTNCLAPAAKTLHEAFGIKRALMTTIHAATTSQQVLDLASGDLRRSRATLSNIIPTTTGAAKAVGLVLPELNGKINGMAFRVPTLTGSVVDLTVELEKDVTAAEVNAAFKAVADSEGWMGKVLDYTEDPIVSADIIGHAPSSTIDALSTDVMDGNLVKVVTWYDNEWSYSSRLADLAVFVAEKL
ncbi:MAG: type I glyceraldehyde-3-phosphate dehydrogenase [Chloroflexi bacterium]|nr:type I glyceraldehyde-3-phosphate dehydrogenase [Chloroflexota bacterium]